MVRFAIHWAICKSTDLFGEKKRWKERKEEEDSAESSRLPCCWPGEVEFRRAFWMLSIIFDCAEFSAVCSRFCWSGSLRSNCAHIDFNVLAGQEGKKQIKKGKKIETCTKKGPTENSPGPPHLPLVGGNNYEASNELIRAAVFRPGCVLSSWTVSTLSPPQHLMTFCSVDNLGHRDYIL